MNVAMGVLLCVGAMILSGILGWRKYQTYAAKKKTEEMLAKNRQAILKVMVDNRLVHWLRISSDGKVFESIPVTASENTDRSPLDRLTQAAVNGEIIIAEMPIPHEEDYSSGKGNAEWMKARALALLQGNHVQWITDFLPAKVILNTLVPAAAREQGATLFSPPPVEEDHTLAVPLAKEPTTKRETPPPSSPRSGATLVQNSETSTPTGTLLDKRTVALLPGTGSVVVEVPGSNKPVLVPRNVRGVRLTPPGSGN